MNRQEVYVKVPSRPDIERFIAPEKPWVVYVNTCCTKPGMTMILPLPVPEKQKQQ